PETVGRARVPKARVTTGSHARSLAVMDDCSTSLRLQVSGTNSPDRSREKKSRNAFSFYDPPGAKCRRSCVAPARSWKETERLEKSAPVQPGRSKKLRSSSGSATDADEANARADYIVKSLNR